MILRLSRHRRVECRAALEIPLSAVSVWGQIRNFQCYARQDFFHADIAVEGGVPRAGAARLTLCHRYAGIRLIRVGRILVWREGVGYSFSDLSARGPHAGFPHTFSYRLQAVGPESCRLHIHVAGKWTAPGMPRWLARLWLRWVFGHVVRTVNNELMIYQAWRLQKRERPKALLPQK